MENSEQNFELNIQSVKKLLDLLELYGNTNDMSFEEVVMSFEKKTEISCWEWKTLAFTSEYTGNKFIEQKVYNEIKNTIEELKLQGFISIRTSTREERKKINGGSTEYCNALLDFKDVSVKLMGNLEKLMGVVFVKYNSLLAGPPRHLHGGQLMLILDGTIGFVPKLVLAQQYGLEQKDVRIVTGCFNIKFLQPIPLDAKFMKFIVKYIGIGMEERKKKNSRSVPLEFTVTSIDESIIYATGEVIFIMQKNEEKEEEKEHKCIDNN